MRWVSAVALGTGPCPIRPNIRSAVKIWTMASTIAAVASVTFIQTRLGKPSVNSAPPDGSWTRP